MMVHTDCRSLLLQMSDYIDGELADELCAGLQEHLRNCTNCRMVYNSTQRTIELYHTEDVANPLPLEVRERLFTRLSLENILPPNVLSRSSSEARALRAGNRCPHCNEAILDYDGLLNLICPKCGQVDGGSNT